VYDGASFNRKMTLLIILGMYFIFIWSSEDHLSLLCWIEAAVQLVRLNHRLAPFVGGHSAAMARAVQSVLVLLRCLRDYEGVKKVMSMTFPD
jgi:hypothetical protein